MHFIKRDEIDEQLPGWLADRITASADGEGRYSLDAYELVRGLGGDGDRLRALLGHLTRARVISPSPSAPDRLAGRVLGRFRPQGRRALPLIDRGRRARPLAPVPRDLGLRGAGELPPRGDPAPLRRPLPGRAAANAAATSATPGSCRLLRRPTRSRSTISTSAIFSVAQRARPAVGRTTCAEILHGGRSKKLLRNSYDGLPAYGSSSRMRRADIVARVDELIEEGRLETTGGPYPVLRIPAGAPRAEALPTTI